MGYLIRAGLIAFGIAAAGLAACATGNASGIFVPGRTIDEQIALIADHTTIQVPEGAEAPVPAAVLLHGCGGLRRVQANYAAALLAAGYGVIIVDSNAARGIGRFGAMSQVCTALRLWGQERAADIEAALALARADARIDADRLAVIGWSHGGWALLEALDYAGENRFAPALEAAGTEPLAGVKSAIAIYPYCGFPVRADGRGFDAGIALHAILAERDVVAPPGDCRRLFDRAAGAGVSVDHQTWPGLTHAFDEPDQPPDPRMEYDADAAARARTRIVEILDADLAGDQG